MNNIEINDKLEIDIENKYIKYKENVKFTTEEAIYILKRKDFCDEVENIAIENLIQENKELKLKCIELFAEKSKHEKFTREAELVKQNLKEENKRLIEERKKNKKYNFKEGF